jgi:hypothetical protein
VRKSCYRFDLCIICTVQALVKQRTTIGGGGEGGKLKALCFCHNERYIVIIGINITYRRLCAGVDMGTNKTSPAFACATAKFETLKTVSASIIAPQKTIKINPKNMGLSI